MKALTVWQPWASLLACGAKKYETRGWATRYRGPIAIHAGKKDPHSIMVSLPHNISKAIYDCMYAKFGIQSGALNKMPTGCIIATAELVECWEIHGASMPGSSSRDVFIEKYDSSDPNGLTWISTWISPQEYIFGNFTPGRYAWEFANMKMLAEPVPAKGMQGLWNWDEKKHEETTTN